MPAWAHPNEADEHAVERAAGEVGTEHPAMAGADQG